MVRTVHPALEPIAARGGQVVVISSVYAFATGSLVTPYATAKAGVEALGRALRVELAPHGASATVAHFGFVDTSMVQEATEKNERNEVLDSLPAFVSRRLSPAQAATALVDGIERRAPRVIAPGWWKVPYYLRGVFGPLMDRRTSADQRVMQVMREGDVPDPEAPATPPRRPRPPGRRPAPRTPRRARRPRSPTAATTGRARPASSGAGRARR